MAHHGRRRSPTEAPRSPRRVGLAREGRIAYLLCFLCFSVVHGRRAGSAEGGLSGGGRMTRCAKQTQLAGAGSAIVPNEPNPDPYLTGGAARNREIRSAKLEARNKLEKEMIQTHRKRKTKPIGPGPWATAEHRLCQTNPIGSRAESSYLFVGEGVMLILADCAAEKTNPMGRGPGQQRNTSSVKQTQFAGAVARGFIACVPIGPCV